MTERIKNLAELPLASLRAHDGLGEIGFHRVFEQTFFRAACHFVDYAVLPPGASIGVHRHGEDEEIYLVLSGSGLMILDGVEHRVGAGSVIVNRPGGAHGLLNDGDADLRLFVVEISVP